MAKAKANGNVVQLRTRNSGATEDEDEFVETLRGLVWSDARSTNRTWEQLADQANLCYSTVRNLASGDTKRPHARTLNRLLKAMGFRQAIVLANTPRLHLEIDAAEVRKHIGQKK